MWSGPRNISTALMRSFENRPDTIVEDEPFYAHYLLSTGILHPGRKETLETMSTNINEILEEKSNINQLQYIVNTYNDNKQLYIKVSQLVSLLVTPFDKLEIYRKKCIIQSPEEDKF